MNRTHYYSNILTHAKPQTEVLTEADAKSLARMAPGMSWNQGKDLEQILSEMLEWMPGDFHSEVKAVFEAHANPKKKVKKSRR